MRVPRRLVTAAAVLCMLAGSIGPAAASFAPGPLADFQAQLSALTLRSRGRMAVAVEDVASGASAGVNAGAEMPAASTIKIPVMVEVFRQLADGSFDLNTRVVLRASDRDWGFGDLSDARTGSSYSVGRLLALMIDVSDNTATNMLIRLVGRQRINATMSELGLTHTRLGDFIRSSGPIRWALRSSPADMVHLLGEMARERLVDEWSSRQMVAILTGQKHNTLLPQPLPAGTTVAHKTGTLSDTLCDVGIVYLEGNPYVIAVMTTSLPTLETGRRFIRGVSRLAYDALGSLGTQRDTLPAAGLPESERAAPAVTATAAPDVQMWTPQGG